MDACSSYLVGLLYENPPVVDGKRLLERLQRRFPAMTAIGDLQFVLPPDAPEYAGVPIPCNWVVAPVETPPDPAKLIRDAAQTWFWPEVKSVLARCRHKLAAGDLMGTMVPPAARLELLHGFLAAVVEETTPLAIEWIPSERFVDPARYLAAVAAGPEMAFGAAAVNVRMFNVGDGGKDEKVMDTRGMAALGLPDVQCHFAGLPPEKVAPRLASTASYILQRGDFIKDGDTVDGIEDQVWKARHEESLVAPPRVVLDLAPPDRAPSPSAEGADPVAELDARRHKEAEGNAKVMLGIALVIAILLILFRFLH